MHKEALLQTGLGTKQGGLGARRAVDLLLPAFLASAVQAKPLVMHTANAFSEIGLLPAGFAEHYDAKPRASQVAFTAKLTAVRAERLDALIARATDDATTRADALAEGRSLPRPTLAAGYTRDGAEALISLVGGEDL